MSGKNLSFLSKKSWHTGTIRHMDKVWKAEQKHEAEQKKIQELQKELERERSRKDLLDAKTGGSSNTGKESLEWMYRGVLSSKTTEQELNKPYIAPDEKEDLTTPSLLQRKPVSATQDDWNKVMEDPLLSIKQKEQETLKMIANNPVKMNEIMKALEKQGQIKKKKKSKSSHKKEKSKKRKSYSRSPSPPRKKQRTSSNPNVSGVDRSYSSSRKHRELKYRNRDRSRSPSYSSHRYHSSSSRRINRSRSPRRTSRSRSPSHSYSRRRDYDVRRSNRSPSRNYYSSRGNKARTSQLSEEQRAAAIREMAADGKANYEMKVKRYLKDREGNQIEDEELQSRNEDENFIS